MADVTDATFETEVLERSKTVPVVIDLWAPWCGPCQSLGPILEKVIGETQGLVELAKVDVDENPAISQAFEVQSIPAVYAMVDGKVVDGFMGAKGEPDVVEFVQGLLNMSAGVTTADAEDAGEGGAADEAVDAPPSQDAAAAPVAPAAAITPDAVISEPGMAPTPIAQPAPSAAEADAIEGQLKELLTQVKGDDEKREQYLALLEKLGAEDPRTNDYRRKLATALF